jgi:hypothetical protein
MERVHHPRPTSRVSVQLRQLYLGAWTIVKFAKNKIEQIGRRDPHLLSFDRNDPRRGDYNEFTSDPEGRSSRRARENNMVSTKSKRERVQEMLQGNITASITKKLVCSITKLLTCRIRTINFVNFNFNLHLTYVTKTSKHHGRLIGARSTSDAQDSPAKTTTSEQEVGTQSSVGGLGTSTPPPIADVEPIDVVPTTSTQGLAVDQAQI